MPIILFILIVSLIALLFYYAQKMRILPVYKIRMNISLVIWFIFGLISIILKQNGYEKSIFYALSYLLSYAAIIIACYSNAKGKGHTGVWGLLGIFSVLGFLILMFFPDKNKIERG